MVGADVSTLFPLEAWFDSHLGMRGTSCSEAVKQLFVTKRTLSQYLVTKPNQSCYVFVQ